MTQEQDTQVRVVRRYVPDTPEGIKQRRERIIAILRKYRAYIFTPENPQKSSRRGSESDE